MIREGAVEGRFENWGEVVTSSPYRKVRLDHLLSKGKSKGWIAVGLLRAECAEERREGLGVYSRKPERLSLHKRPGVMK